jgi:hypothetical protein
VASDKVSASDKVISCDVSGAGAKLCKVTRWLHPTRDARTARHPFLQLLLLVQSVGCCLRRARVLTTNW